jgi:hypothetical protein
MMSITQNSGNNSGGNKVEAYEQPRSSQVPLIQHVLAPARCLPDCGSSLAISRRSIQFWAANFQS